jgi:hypothetical protein
MQGDAVQYEQDPTYPVNKNEPTIPVMMLPSRFKVFMLAMLKKTNGTTTVNI